MRDEPKYSLNIFPTQITNFGLPNVYHKTVIFDKRPNFRISVLVQKKLDSRFSDAYLEVVITSIPLTGIPPPITAVSITPLATRVVILNKLNKQNSLSVNQLQYRREKKKVEIEKTSFSSQDFRSMEILSIGKNNRNPAELLENISERKENQKQHEILVVFELNKISSTKKDFLFRN